MELLVLLTLLGMLDRRKTSSLPEQAKGAAKDAEKKREKAEQTNRPEDQKKAEQAERKAETLNTAARTPPPWPQVIPAGLPPFPSGWTPDEPVGAGVMVGGGNGVESGLGRYATTPFLLPMGVARYVIQRPAVCSVLNVPAP